MPTPLNMQTQEAVRRRMSPLYQKERTEIPLKGAGEYPFPPRGATPAPRMSPPAMGAGMSPGGGARMGLGGGAGMGVPSVGLGGLAGAPSTTGAVPSALGVTPPGAPVGLPTQGMPQTGGVPVERQRDVLLALILMLLGGVEGGVGGGGQYG